MNSKQLRIENKLNKMFFLQTRFSVNFIKRANVTFYSYPNIQLDDKNRKNIHFIANLHNREIRCLFSYYLLDIINFFRTIFGQHNWTFFSYQNIIFDSNSDAFIFFRYIQTIVYVNPYENKNKLA